MWHHRQTFAVCAALAAALLAGPAWSVPPPFMPIQGVLRDNAGLVVSQGTFAMTFALYGAEGDAAPVWSETWPPGGESCALVPDPCVAVQGGVFTVLLGTHVPLDPQIFAAAPELWLGVRVEGEPELPRRRLGSSAYALHAATAGEAAGLACSECVNAGALGFPAAAGDVHGGSALHALSADTAAGLDCQGCVPMGALGDDVKAAIAASAPGPGDLPHDGLDEVSNGTLTNHFAITATSTDTPKTVPGFWFDPTVSKLQVPDLGVTTTFSVTVNIAHPQPQQLVVVLTPPAGLGTPVTLHALGPGTPGGLSGTWPTELTPASGSLEQWVGTNPAGEWTLGVKDELPPGDDGTLQSWSLSFDYLSSQVVKATGDLSVAGDVAIGGSVACNGCVGEPALATGVRFPGVLVASTSISGCSGNGGWSSSFTVPAGATHALVWATGGTGAQGQSCGLSGVLIPGGGSLWCRDTGNVSQSVTLSLGWGTCSGSYLSGYGTSIGGTIRWYR
ncbi:MAG: hypothetical protein AMXMBFR64_54920 [Myxococcales bacterium]